jgi:hypothetical protein
MGRFGARGVAAILSRLGPITVRPESVVLGPVAAGCLTRFSLLATGYWPLSTPGGGHALFATRCGYSGSKSLRLP